MTHRPPPDFLSAIHATYTTFIGHQSVGALHTLTGKTDEDLEFDAFCTIRGGLRCLEEIQRTTNAMLNAAFYVAAYATTPTVFEVPGDVNFDPDIPALHVLEKHLPKASLLYALEATLALTPWVQVECDHAFYNPAGNTHDTLVLKRDLMLSLGVTRQYSPENSLRLLRPITLLAHWFLQQVEPVRFPVHDLHTLIAGYLEPGELLNR